MHVAMVTEGTYPFAHGGVSVWCDQLIRGLFEHSFEVFAITGAGGEAVCWDLPANVELVRQVPLWGPRKRGTGTMRQARSRRGALPRARRVDPLVGDVTLSLGHALIEPDLAVARRKFHSALYSWSRLGPQFDVEAALVSPEFITMLMDRWGSDLLSSRWGGRSRGVPTVGDAVTASRLLAHSLRPLTEEPPRTDLVHLVANGIAGLVGMAAKWAYGTPYVLSEHGVYLRERYLSYGRSAYSWPVKWLLLRFHRLLASAVYREAALVAPGNVYNQRWEIWDGVPDGAIRTVYNGVDPDEFAVAENEPSEPTLTWVGRIDPIKDLETLLRAFALVHTRMPNARLRIFGGTPRGNEDYLALLVNLSHDLGLDSCVTFEGRVEVIRDAYAAGNAVLLTSISEGFPYTVIEAMSCGRATVSTDVGGVREAVGDAGLIVAPRNPQAFADACVTLLTDHDQRHRFAQRARTRVIELFTLEHSLDAFRTIYADVAAASARLDRMSA